MGNLFNIQGQVVVITGGLGVLGRGIAAYLAGEGARVVILGRKAEEGDRLVTEIKAAGGEALFLLTDVMNRELLEQNREAILSKYGRIDTLLNAAGGNMKGATIPPDQTFLDLKLEDFRQVVDLNLFGTVLPTMVFVPEMAKQGKGSIVNFASESALRPLTRVVGYGCAKAAITNFTRYMAAELAQKFSTGIRVNAIAPGFIQTPWHENRTQESYDRINRKIALHRFGEIKDVADMAYSILTNHYMNGSIVDIHGGYDYF